MAWSPAVIRFSEAACLFMISFCYIGLGIYITSSTGSFGAMLNVDGYMSFPNMGPAFIALASVIFIIALCRCFQVIDYNPPKAIFRCITMLLVIPIIVITVSCFTTKGQIREILGQSMKNGLKNYRSDANGLDDAWDFVQQEYKCCGVKSYVDWKNATIWQHYNTPVSHGGKVPDSCCKIRMENCGNDVLFESHPSEIYTNGCFDILNQYASTLISREAWVILGVVLGSMLLFIIVVIIIGHELYSMHQPGKYEELGP